MRSKLPLVASRVPLSTSLASSIENPASRNPSRTDIFDRLRAGETSIGELRFLQQRGGFIAGRLGPKGPCSAFVLRLALRPTLMRIDRLRTAAQSIGHPQDYRQAIDETPDELGELAQSIDDAHKRILTDTDALAAHSQAIENHLHAVEHNLRTPISALQLTIQRAALTGDDAERRTLLNEAMSELEYAVSDVVIVLDQVGERFQIQVIDDGSGVDTDDLANLTDWAIRTNVARQRDRVGSGLGLAITRQVCERAGWDLAISNAEGGGLCVEIPGPLA